MKIGADTPFSDKHFKIRTFASYLFFGLYFTLAGVAETPLE